MKKKKGFVGIGIILAIIAVLAIGGGVYYIGKKSNTLPKVEENNLPQENQNDVVNVPVVNNQPVINNQVDNTANNNTTTTTTVTTSTTTSCLPTTAPWLKVLSPNGGETYTVGQTITVKWKDCNVPSSSNDIVVALHQNGDWQNVVFLSEATTNDGSKIFTIPNVTLGSYKIRIGSASANVQQDFSDNLFTINAKTVIPTPTNTVSLYTAVIVFKTTGNYSNLVSVDLDRDRQIVTAWPNINEIQPPVALHSNYFTGGFGGDPYGGFLSMSIVDYKNLTVRPTIIEINNLILDKNPFSEMYRCFIAPVNGVPLSYADAYNVVNNYIDNNQLSTKCKKEI